MRIGCVHAIAGGDDGSGGGSGFTLIELLAVIAVVVILVAMLVPAVTAGYGAARDMECRSQLRQIANGMIFFASDHGGVLPGNFAQGWTGPEDWQGPWMGAEVLASGYDGAFGFGWPERDGMGQYRKGTLLPYLGGEDTARKLYRCPGLSVAPLNSGRGSNGMFDYVMPLVFAGTRLSLIPTRARLIGAPAGMGEVPCPLVLEEDPMFSVNAGWIEPGWAGTDRLGAWHRGGGNYGASDGSVFHLACGSLGPAAAFAAPRFEVKAPTGAITDLRQGYGAGERFAGWVNAPFVY